MHNKTFQFQCQHNFINCKAILEIKRTKYGKNGPMQHGNIAVCQQYLKQSLVHARLTFLAFLQLILTFGSYFPISYLVALISANGAQHSRTWLSLVV